MADLVLIEGVGAELVLAAAERERADGKERQQQAFAAADRAVAAEGFGRSSASTEKVTAPQWQLPWNDMAMIL
ncbi:hypothetical protein AK51_23595 [Serratia nematodiphila DZ0503SBS1]|nr:hypothetical protein AK51_23595 [Serratia nematodiphila DZ0503SBS1]